MLHVFQNVKTSFDFNSEKNKMEEANFLVTKDVCFPISDCEEDNCNKRNLKESFIQITHKLKILKENKPLLTVLDSVLSSCIIGPLVVFFWRGTWELQINYKDHFPLEMSFLFSIITQVCFTLTRETLQELHDSKDRSECFRFVGKILRIIYSYVFTVVCVMHWRSTWELCEKYFLVDVNEKGTAIGGNVHYTYILAVVALMVLVGTKTVINVIDSPYCIIMDTDESAFDFPTRFHVKVCKIEEVIKTESIETKIINIKTESVKHRKHYFNLAKNYQLSATL